ncbi:hypothetical protein bthur0001_54690 [Bacillus thuringiensis serovar tochigiensis BGSC 4Y1]|nr:hypothetical protein bthur0001_54690 [Bacillus thuringiensis serovar tochigiensis BGSC 4Y1]
MVLSGVFYDIEDTEEPVYLISYTLGREFYGNKKSREIERSMARIK